MVGASLIYLMASVVWFPSSRSLTLVGASFSQIASLMFLMIVSTAAISSTVFFRLVSSFLANVSFKEKSVNREQRERERERERERGREKERVRKREEIG